VKVLHEELLASNPWISAVEIVVNGMGCSPIAFLGKENFTMIRVAKINPARIIFER
jgi:hypothetical protein